MIIHARSTFKRKKKNPTAKERKLQEDWEKMIQKYSLNIPKSTKPSKAKTSDAWVYSLGVPACRETPKIPSLPFTGDPCLKKENQKYTGTLIKGIATMHKSNAVPVINEEQAIEISRMRRN